MRYRIIDTESKVYDFEQYGPESIQIRGKILTEQKSMDILKRIFENGYDYGIDICGELCLDEDELPPMNWHQLKETL